MYKVKYAHQEGIKIGFNRFNFSDEEQLENQEEEKIEDLSEQVGTVDKILSQNVDSVKASV